MSSFEPIVMSTWSRVIDAAPVARATHVATASRTSSGPATVG